MQFMHLFLLQLYGSVYSNYYDFILSEFSLMIFVCLFFFFIYYIDLVIVIVDFLLSSRLKIINHYF